MEQQIDQSSVATAQKLGLSESEYHKIVEIMGREPNFTELSIYSVMWSEHCSYKNSIKYLKTLPRKGEHLLVEAGEENAGLVDIGGGLACAFKIESHNHPSALEPYQGAATGVGGIHRDIFTMGARPIAALNSLRFGNIENKHMQHLVKGVVKGIGDYGNCLGVPTVGGEIYFDPSYNQNILVNAMSVGIVEAGNTISAISFGPGNPVFIVGSATGKDGIHGATFASADLTEDSADDLPAVQVGDPFQEKLLLEASLEAIDTGAMVGMQDMGAAGITCSTSEMSAKGECGMIIHLDKVPTRQANMKPFEILLSESQERMLIVCKKGREQELIEVFDKWDLECEQIGEVTASKNLQFFMNEELVADVDAHSLVLGGGAPVYDREFSEPTYFKEYQKFSIDTVAEGNLLNSATTLASSPNIASKKWVFNQYDSMVRTNTRTTNDPSDAAIIRVKNTNKSLAVTTDCNSSYVNADPHKGTMIAVSEAARNIVCSGGTPVAITNCLNFGNPNDPEVYWQFVNAIKGMGEACEKFTTPVTGGNVSFYNQSQFENKTTPVNPTPTIGMLGMIENEDHIMGLSFINTGDTIYQLGSTQNDISQSEYLKRVHNIEASTCPWFELDYEYELQSAVSKLIKSKAINSAHDITEGGLFFALLESCYSNNLGFDINTQKDIRSDAFLFGESQSRVIVSVSEEQKSIFMEVMEKSGFDFSEIGHTTEGNIFVDKADFKTISDWKKKHNSVLESHLN